MKLNNLNHALYYNIFEYLNFQILNYYKLQ